MAGRRSKKTREERIADLQLAINRSGLIGVEVVQMMVDWQHWKRVTVEAGNGMKFDISPTEKAA